MLFVLCCLVWISAAILGGATASGYLGDFIVQILSVPLLIVAVWPALGVDHPGRKQARLTLLLCGASALVLLVQVLPLPGQAWRDGGGLFSAGMAGGSKPDWPEWNTFSLTPEATWAAVASLIVPLSIFGAAMQLSFRQRRMLTMLLLGIAALSLVLGFAQIAQGPESALRFYDVTNLTEAVGFFANRNHFAAFLSIALVLAGIFFIEAAETSLGRGRANSRAGLFAVALAAFAVAVLAGLAVARSRAGFLLAMLALAGLFAILTRQPRQKSDRSNSFWLSVRRLSTVTLLLGVLFAGTSGLERILTRFEGDSVEHLRGTFNRTTWETAFKALPFGTGLGSFVPVYATVEREQDIFPRYANRAHDDFAELFLETGLIGAVLLLAFLIWFLSRCYRVWTQASGHAPKVALEQGATVAILLLLAHSAVDYPLRTTALGTVFAFFCGILAAPSRESESITREKSRRAVPAAPPMNPVPSEYQKLETKIEWPEAWRRERHGSD